MPTTLSQVDEAVAEIRRQWRGKPRAGIILGTGMSKLVDYIETPCEIPFHAIPHFPQATAIGHKGRLVCGRLAGTTVLVMDGRCHLYEGYTGQQITLPVHAMHSLGIELLIVGNAGGGVNPALKTGDIILLESHINLMGRRLRLCWTELPSVPPTRGGSSIRPTDVVVPCPSGRVVRTTVSPYDPILIDRAQEIAGRNGFVAYRGVYVAVTGPNYETRAEYRFFRQIGGDVIGMSTVPEVTVAARLRIRVLALSGVTNVALPDVLKKVSGDEIVAAGQAVEPKVRIIVTGILAEGL